MIDQNKLREMADDARMLAMYLRDNADPKRIETLTQVFHDATDGYTSGEVIIGLCASLATAIRVINHDIQGSRGVLATTAVTILYEMIRERDSPDTLFA